jgi:hypothetical protein
MERHVNRADVYRNTGTTLTFFAPLNDAGGEVVHGAMILYRSMAKLAMRFSGKCLMIAKTGWGEEAKRTSKYSPYEPSNATSIIVDSCLQMH